MCVSARARVCVCVCACVCVCERERERETETDRDRDRHRQTETQTDRQTDRDREREHACVHNMEPHSGWHRPDNDQLDHTDTEDYNILYPYNSNAINYQQVPANTFCFSG